jgi:hypothetical protein
MTSEDNTEPGNAIDPSRPSNNSQRNSEQPDSESADGSRNDAQVTTAEQHGCSSEQKKHRLDYAIFWAALVAAISTLLAAGFTGWQAWIAKDTAERQLRAYVLFKDANLSNWPEVIFIFHNSGQTPGYNVKSNIEVLVEDPAFEKSIVPLVPQMQGPPIGPGSLSDVRWTMARVVSPAEIADIQQGKRMIFLHGRIEYDSFGKRHYSNFCAKYSGPFPTHSYFFLFCKNGNETDEKSG